MMGERSEAVTSICELPQKCPSWIVLGRGDFSKKGLGLIYPALRNLDHIWQSQQTLGNARRKILTLLKT